MIKPSNTNEEFACSGISHVALVCSDMARTVDVDSNTLGMPLVEALDLPDGLGQHFFFDAGNGDCVAFSWFAEAPDRVPVLSCPAAIPGIGEIVSAVEFACWTREFGEADPWVVPRTAAARRNPSVA